MACVAKEDIFKDNGQFGSSKSWYESFGIFWDYSKIDIKLWLKSQDIVKIWRVKIGKPLASDLPQSQPKICTIRYMLLNVLYVTTHKINHIIVYIFNHGRQQGALLIAKAFKSVILVMVISSI